MILLSDYKFPTGIYIECSDQRSIVIYIVSITRQGQAKVTVPVFRNAEHYEMTY